MTNTNIPRKNTPIELVKMYIERVYENHEYQLVREIFSNPMVRHDPNGIVVLSHDDQIARLEKYQAQMGANFENITIHGNDEFVSVVYNMFTTRGRPFAICSIETWRVQDGLITDCWNSPYVEGKWGDPDKPETLQRKVSTPKLMKDSDYINREWLTDVFAQAQLETPRIELITPTPLTSGNAGKTIRLNIDYNAAPGKAPQALICKMTSDNPQMASMMMQGGVNIAEVNAIKMLVREEIINTPTLYFGEIDSHGFHFNLLSEDLDQRGGYEADQLGGLTVVQAESVCEQFNKLHSHFWNDASIEEREWLNRPAKASTDAFFAGLQVARDYFGDLLSEPQYELIENFAVYIEDWFNYNYDKKTVIHADARSANILFCPSSNGRDEAFLIDWQTVTLGHPTRDLAYFLGVSISTEDRRDIEHRLLTLHTDAMATKDSSYNLEKASQEYRFNLFAGVWGAVATCAYAHTDELRKVLYSWLPRSLTAVEDWDSLSLVKDRFTNP